MKYGVYRIKGCSGYQDYGSKGRCIKTLTDLNEAYRALARLMDNVRRTGKHSSNIYSCRLYGKCKATWIVREKE